MEEYGGDVARASGMAKALIESMSAEEIPLRGGGACIECADPERGCLGRWMLDSDVLSTRLLGRRAWRSRYYFSDAVPGGVRAVRDDQAGSGEGEGFHAIPILRSKDQPLLGLILRKVVFQSLKTPDEDGGESEMQFFSGERFMENFEHGAEMEIPCEDELVQEACERMIGNLGAVIAEEIVRKKRELGSSEKLADAAPGGTS